MADFTARQIEVSRRGCRNGNAPFNGIAASCPAASYYSVRSRMGCRYTRETSDREIGLYYNVLKADFNVVAPYASKVFITQGQQLTQQHYMVAAVHRGVGSIAVP